MRVRKGRGVVHLTVRADAERTVLTLCERSFAPGEFTVTEEEPTCAACLRRRDDPSRISNALFEQDLGSKLLELSLANARKRPEDQQADDRAARAAPPRLTVVPSEARTPREQADSQARAGNSAKRPEAPPPVAAPEVSGLDLSRFEKVGRDLYRSPHGVTLRLVKRDDGTWDVAAIDHDGEVRLEQLADGRVRLKIGDVRLEYSGRFERRIRLS